MSRWNISPSKLKGALKVPSSKSQSIRALLFAALAKGKSRIYNLLPSPDVEAMIQACQIMGGEFDNGIVTGVEGDLGNFERIINAGNSGLILRLVGAVASLSSKPIILTGDHSVCHNRPVKPLLSALNQLGVEAFSTGGAPIYIKGPLQSGHAQFYGEDSQPVSGMLIAASFAPGPIELLVENPGEKPWVNLTLSWLEKLGLSYVMEDDFSYFKVPGKGKIEGFEYHVPGDYSSLAFPLVAALLTGSQITLQNLDPEDPQGDRKIIEILKQMGGNIEEEGTCVHVRPTSALEGREIDVNGCIDATPILAVAACFAEGTTHLKGAQIARYKECDRLACITQELHKMGAQIEEHEDGLLIHHAPLKGNLVQSHADHRMALALAVAGMAAEGDTTVEGVEWSGKSYPTFKSDMQILGAEIR